MKVTLATLCDYANVTVEGKLNILGTFQEINAPVLPFALPVMFLVVGFSAAPSEAPSKKQVTVKLLAEDGAELLTAVQEIDLPKPPRPGARLLASTVLGLAGIAFPKAGDYAFSILVDGDEKESVPLRVNSPT